MESLLTSFVDGDWDLCDRNLLNNDVDFMLHQLFSDEVGEGSSSSSLDAPTMWSFLENDSNLTEAGQNDFHFHPMESMYTNSNHLSEYHMADAVASPVPFFSNVVPEGSPFMAGFETSRVEPDILINTPFNLKRNLELCTSQVPNKKTRTMKNVEATTSFSSEDDSNASQDLNAVGSSETKQAASDDKNGKKKGRRGTAIDPQSLYARKRRDRINERLRILQNLVPNGTKVDISTMLEEAVSYVKFLQTQIKLLSSDDLWMYAPIAYNGVDVGLDMRLSQKL